MCVLVREEIHEGRLVYLCNCGLEYDDPLIAFACEDYARTHGVNSEEITRRANRFELDQVKSYILK